MKNSPSFGFLRRNFFPIHNHELKKFLYLSTIFFFISFNYAVLRTFKDKYVLEMGGSPALSACKLWGVLPVLMFFNVVYGYISQRTNRVARFNMVIAYFLIYFSLFVLLIFPKREWLEFEGFETTMRALIPLKSLHGLWMVIRYWPVTVFYIHAEAWGTFALSILFYTFANEIVSTKQSGRFYPFLSVAANVGTVLAGLFMMDYFVKPSLEISMVSVIFNGIILIVIYTYFSNLVTKDPEKYEVEANKPKKKKAKLSVIESLKVLLNSQYLLRLGFIVFSYAACINLYETMYKNVLKSVAGDQLQYYGGLQLCLIGITAIVFSLFLGAPAMKLGWRFMGSVSPVMLLANCILFLFVILMGEYFNFIAKGLGITVGFLGLFVGLFGVVFIKGSKYTFFDPFKENSYIPLTREEKILGKASIENLSRWGKAAGSLFVTVILPPLTPEGENPIEKFRLPIAFIIIIMVATWLIAVQDLTSRFHALVAKKKTGKQERQD